MKMRLIVVPLLVDRGPDMLQNLKLSATLTKEALERFTKLKINLTVRTMPLRKLFLGMKETIIAKRGFEVL
jgi:hypothetical protein